MTAIYPLSCGPYSEGTIWPSWRAKGSGHLSLPLEVFPIIWLLANPLLHPSPSCDKRATIQAYVSYVNITGAGSRNSWKRGRGGGGGQGPQNQGQVRSNFQTDKQKKPQSNLLASLKHSPPVYLHMCIPLMACSVNYCLHIKLKHASIHKRAPFPVKEY